MSEIKGDVELQEKEALGTEIINALDDCGIHVCGVYARDGGNGEKFAELEYFSPAGEDFIFTVDFINKAEFAEQFKEYADDFDVDEHVEAWIGSRGKNGVPETARELVEDAESIQSFLQDTANVLEGIDMELTLEQMIGKDTVKILEDNGFDLQGYTETDGYSVECQWRSPSGEDVDVAVYFNTPDEFKKAFAEFANEYDVQDNFDEWSARRGVSISERISDEELMNDANAIKDKLMGASAMINGEEKTKKQKSNIDMER